VGKYLYLRAGLQVSTSSGYEL